MKQSIIVLRAVVLLVAAIETVTAQQESADLVVTNAKVITIDAQRPLASAFAVKEGKFVAVGETSEWFTCSFTAAGH